MIAYHFTGATLRDGRPLPPIGFQLVHEGPLIPCVSGLHASLLPFDALGYAPGPLLHRVELADDAIPHGPPHKLVSRTRTILASVDASVLLRAFAREQALGVVNLWDAPEIVVRYLQSGDESIRATANDPVKAAALEAAMDAAFYAAFVAQWATAGADFNARAAAAFGGGAS